MRRRILTYGVLLIALVAVLMPGAGVEAGRITDLAAPTAFVDLDVCRDGVRFQLVDKKEKYTTPAPYTAVVTAFSLSGDVVGQRSFDLVEIEPFIIPSSSAGQEVNLSRFHSIRWNKSLPLGFVVKFNVNVEGTDYGDTLQYMVNDCVLSQAYLDKFDRSNGGVGSTWLGDTNACRIDGQDLHIDTDNPFALYWHDYTWQEASMKLTNIDPDASEQGLLLQVQGDPPDYRNGAIKLLYDVRNKQVRIETWTPGASSWTPRFTRTLANAELFKNGDTLGAAVVEDPFDPFTPATIMISRKSADNVTKLLGVVDTVNTDLSFFRGKGGRIGIWSVGAGDAVVDTFVRAINPP